jgi:signal transduction histidine kinase
MQEENELLEKIEQRKYKYQRKQSSIVNNFFTIITIAIVSIVIIWYVNLILPGQKQNKLLENQKHEKYQILKEKQNKRLEQIELSKRLHDKS